MSNNSNGDNAVWFALALLALIFNHPTLAIILLIIAVI